MDGLIERLKEYGADIEGIMGRFLNDVDLYKSCFATFLEEQSFRKLGEALAAEDYKSAFEHAHSLKGVTGNMGLTPLYQVVCKIVEELRKNETSKLEEYYTCIMEQLVILKKLQ